MTTHENIFTSLYNNCTWGDNEDLQYKGSSGYGSTLTTLSGTFIPFINNFILLNNIKTVVDLGCGDFVCGEILYKDIPNLTYTGYDVYKNVINALSQKYKNTNYSFEYLDIFQNRENIKDSELYIIKDVFHHWSNKEIEEFLSFLVTKKFKYILISNMSDIDNFSIDDIETGMFRTMSARNSPLNKFNPIIVMEWGNPEQFLEQPNGKWIRNVSEISLIYR